MELLGQRGTTPRAVPELGLHQEGPDQPAPTELARYLHQKSRYLPDGDEAGTAPSDRKFRPDVEGLRALAILLVVLYHAGVPGLSGGYVGVDVFFVISGFVITGLLLREHAASKRTRLQAFYGRRARRILPAATLVIVVTVVASYRWLGFISGNATANVARAASLFYANFHFIATGTNYLASQQPPSALQNFWSLSVEEQFYLVYPGLFLLVAVLWRRRSLRVKMTLLLSLGIVTSFVWSIHQTSANSVAAYFSPFTRAWELALGGLVAVASLTLSRLPRPVASAMTWAGLAGIVLAAFLFTGTTAYPGFAVALPVVGTALVIAGGTALPRMGAETVLRAPPFQWLGRLSYSLYLWHWPILIIAAQHAGRPLSVTDNLLWLLLALALAAGSYYLVENPIRHWATLRRSAVLSIMLGLLLIAVSLLLVSVELANHSGTSSLASKSEVAPAVSTPTTTTGATSTSSTMSTSPPPGAAALSPAATAVLRSIAASSKITSIPSDLDPSLQSFADPNQANAVAGPAYIWQCDAYGSAAQAASPTPCIFGDIQSDKTIVLVGDSNVGNWAPALDIGLQNAGYRLAVFAFAGCPTPDLHYPSYDQLTSSLLAECNEWHVTAPEAISALRPVAVIAASGEADLSGISNAKWISGFSTLFDQSTVGSPSTIRILLGTSPFPGPTPNCLAANPDPQKCSLHDSPNSGSVYSTFLARDPAIASAAKATLIPTYPWFCHSGTCAPVVSHYLVFADQDHATIAYSEYLSPLITESVTNVLASR
jgi:peptidoglycan/LPS O-acetylase OafA/YrhL